MASLNLKEKDVVHWLEKKISASSSSFTSGGSTSASEINGLWGSRHVCSLVTQELLTEIPPCFVDLQTSTKLKLLLSLLHLTKRNLDQWRDEIEEILTLASQDTDEWVQTVAELLKELSTTGGLSLTMSNEESQFTKALQLLKKILKKQGKEAVQMLPMDAAFVNKTTLQSIWGSNLHPPKHFTLKRKPKAAAQRIELLQKSVDAATQLKNKTRSVSSVVPIKDRNMVRKMDTNGPLPKIPTINAVKASCGFNNNRPTYNRPAVTKKEGGVKLIDIAETPEMLRKRRREMELEEKAAKKAAKEETKRVKLETKAKKARFPESIDEELLHESIDDEDRAPSEIVPPTPNYAADLADASLLAAPTSIPEDPIIKPQHSSVASNAASKQSTVATTAGLQFIPFLPSTASNEVSSFNTFKTTNSASRTSVITDTQLSSATDGAASSVQAPSVYSSFAAAFMQPQLSAKPSSSQATNGVPPQLFTRNPTPVVVQHQQQTSFPPPASASSSSSSQGVQMLRITLGGQPQTVLFQNTPQPAQPVQNKAVYVFGQTGVSPASTKSVIEAARKAAPFSLNVSKDSGQPKRAPAPGPRDFAAPMLQPYHPPQQQQQHQQHFRDSLGGVPIMLQPSTSNSVLSSQQQSGENVPGVLTGPTQIILTKEIMYQAQEMFRTANKLSRPEKALILGFMAGNRENPCPQMGNILTVRLSENPEGEVRQENGSTLTAMVETFFQMNYENGEWKKIRKIRHVPNADG